MSKKRKAKAKPKSKKAAARKKKAPVSKPNPYEEKPKPPSPHPGPYCYFGCRGGSTTKWIPVGVMAYGTNGSADVCGNCEWRAKRYGWMRANHGEHGPVKPA